MPVDVTTEIVINRPQGAVAAYASDPDHAPDWYVNIKSVEWKTPRPLSVGSQIAFVAKFLGRQMAYTYQIVELVAGERLVMRTSEGLFPMETQYRWEPMGPDITRMVLRNHGSPSGFSRLVAPFISRAMGNANRKDLARLKQILEA
ncbi:MAG: SRPBCC family protein [Acidobacteriota bacterium]